MVLSEENGPGAHPARGRNIKNIFLTGRPRPVGGKLHFLRVH
jgi:hypothetical protein